MDAATAKPIKLIAIYARVSTARQEEEETVKTQLSAIRDFAKKNEYVIAQEYIDDGWSGDILARPALDQLRQDAKKRAWDAVLFYDPDRLARRYSFQELVTDELRELGLEPLFVTMPTPKTGEERILHGVRGLFAEYERAKIAERFRLGKLRKAREGHIIVSEAPYGYRLVPKSENGHGYYEVDEVESSVVRKIFSWIADERLTIRKVARRLQESGIPPRKSKRGVWNTSTLGTLVRNATYIGEGRYGASYAVVPQKPLKTEGYRKVKKTSRRLRPEQEWIKIPTPAIIERTLFERTQRQLKLNYMASSRNKKNQYLLGGKVRCTCGRSRVGEGPQHGKYLYYRCTDRVHNYPLPPTCVEKGVNARLADQLVWSRVVQLMSSKGLMLGQARRWINKRRSKPQASAVDVERARAEIAKLKIEEDRYTKAYGAGMITLEQFREYAAPARNRIASLEQQIASVLARQSETSDIALPEDSEVETFAVRAKEGLRDLNFDEKRLIVTSVIDKVIGTPKELLVYGFIPVKWSKHVEFQTNDRYRANAFRHDDVKPRFNGCLDGADTTRHGTRELDGETIPFELRIRLGAQQRKDLLLVE